MLCAHIACVFAVVVLPFVISCGILILLKWDTRFVRMRIPCVKNIGMSIYAHKQIYVIYKYIMI